MAARSLFFVGPERVELRERPVPGPDADEVLVDTLFSAVSPGTELLVYRDEVPEEMAVDETIPALDGSFSYPMTYGYACVGEVTETGADVDDDWVGRTVFVFHPHESRFLARPEELHVVPDGCSPAQATLLPTVETAANLVMDGRPRLGERVAVFGQGPVGLATTAVLSRFPLASLAAVEPDRKRRERALELGADEAYAPADARAELAPTGPATATGEGVDLSVEVSGDPEALDDAVGVAGYDSRVVVGSWYGTKRAPLELGGRYHRSRIELQSSQVSTVDPSLRGRWDKQRRLDTAWDLLSSVDTAQFLTHRVDISDAPDAYELLSDRSDGVVQVLFEY
ncbi:2-desacetyl-2-hydroxyethyl bacteriochlorophyllide A dehydrogenase [Halopelagius inordinatus]|uniref:2-desacetyl-2-hydroxyethyl bacteriochlorophyllide A dehydrogenase n=1 Tax=Halopelagius inordinatus TaxID=553467 RepID=A0A1I2P2J3_9EURY|nr:zinc-binding alcohol dehydrogenase [Halopelagius inordinatus]SFG09843.1 2-desacetyl-2-hydroxyethyl bacteriochlorophyllide A dehydrogenase [Halopelagius inordinatus]